MALIVTLRGGGLLIQPTTGGRVDVEQLRHLTHNTGHAELNLCGGGRGVVREGVVRYAKIEKKQES